MLSYKTTHDYDKSYHSIDISNFTTFKPFYLFLRGMGCWPFANKQANNFR